MATLWYTGNVAKESGVKIFQLSAKLRASLPLNAAYTWSLWSVFQYTEKTVSDILPQNYCLWSEVGGSP